MICKKCGREYEDDMPKCLWCDAPNESLSSQDECETSSADSEAQEEAYKESLKELVDPELERAFDDNVRRGKSAISWTKFQIVLNVIFFFVEVKTFGAFQNYQVGTTVSEEFKSALGTIFLFLLFTSIPFFVFIGMEVVIGRQRPSPHGGRGLAGRDGRGACARRWRTMFLFRSVAHRARSGWRQENHHRR